MEVNVDAWYGACETLKSNRDVLMRQIEARRDCQDGFAFMEIRDGPSDLPDSFVEQNGIIVLGDDFVGQRDPSQKLTRGSVFATYLQPNSSPHWRSFLGYSGWRPLVYTLIATEDIVEVAVANPTIDERGPRLEPIVFEAPRVQPDGDVSGPNLQCSQIIVPEHSLAALSAVEWVASTLAVATQERAPGLKRRIEFMRTL